MGGCTKKLAQYPYNVPKFPALFALKLRKVLFNRNLKWQSVFWKIYRYLLQCTKLVGKLSIWSSRFNINAVLLVHKPNWEATQRKDSCHCSFLGFGFFCAEVFFNDGKTYLGIFFPSFSKWAWENTVKLLKYCHSLLLCMSVPEYSVRTALNYINPKSAFHLLKSDTSVHILVSFLNPFSAPI